MSTSMFESLSVKRTLTFCWLDEETTQYRGRTRVAEKIGKCGNFAFVFQSPKIIVLRQILLRVRQETIFKQHHDA